jgi:hypothetical protein
MSALALMRSPSTRPTTSVKPPATEEETKMTGLLGKFSACAAAWEEANKAKAAKSKLNLY